MKQNLNVSRYRNGDIIPQVTDPTQWANLTTGAWCYYNNDSANRAVYGKLYNWYAVNDARGLAPEGWHVPSDGEWNKMAKCMDANADTICNMCAQSLIAGESMRNTNGFSALPSGYRYIDGSFQALGYFSTWWPSNEFNTTSSCNRSVDWRNTHFGKGQNYWIHGFSVRLIKDEPPSTLNDGLVAYYPFNGNANDESGNGNNGIVNGATLTTDRFGNSDKAYQFGSSNNISVPMSEQLFMLPIRTFSCWFQSNGQQSGGRIYETTFMNGGIAISNGNTLDTWYGYSQHCCNIIGISSGANNQWHHLVSFANDSTGLTEVYLDGTLIVSDIGNASGGNGCFIPNYNWQNHFVRFGLGASGESYNGFIDDIRIYNRALTQEEISYLTTH